MRNIWKQMLLWTAVIVLLAGCAAVSVPETTAQAETSEKLSGKPVLRSEEPMSLQTAPDSSSGDTESEVITACTTVFETEEPDLVETALRKLSLEERVAQLFVVTPEALTKATDSLKTVDEAFRTAFFRIPVGGVLCMGENLKGPEQTKALCNDLQALSLERLGLPLFLCVDEEGGSVARISGNPSFGLSHISPMTEIGATGDPSQAYAIGQTIGTYLSALGFNVDFAPDADVLTNPKNRVVQGRSFGSSAELVTEMASAFSDGLAEQGVLPCWKHFPGHGGTAEDSHKGFAVLHASLDSLLQSEELAPFLFAARAGAPMIMAGHIAVPEATGDSYPASLNEKLIKILRGPGVEYDGLLITDSLGMGAVTQLVSPAEAAVLALQAGNDLLLVSDHLEEAYQAVRTAVADGRISEERINESVRRILRCKEALGAEERSRTWQ